MGVYTRNRVNIYSTSVAQTRVRTRRERLSRLSAETACLRNSVWQRTWSVVVRWAGKHTSDHRYVEKNASRLARYNGALRRRRCICNWLRGQVVLFLRSRLDPERASVRPFCATTLPRLPSSPPVPTSKFTRRPKINHLDDLS
jgi:hypothetical protein